MNIKPKKILLGALIGVLILSSCSNNDDSNSTSIVGIWKPIAEVDVCSTGSKETYDYSSCEQLSRTTFSSNGTLNITEFDDNTGDCIEDYKENGTWTLNGDNLSANLGGETINPTFFELTSNTLRIGYYDNDANNPCDGGNLPSYYYTEYTRVE